MPRGYFNLSNLLLPMNIVKFDSSLIIKTPDKTIDFKVYWNNIGKSMKKRFHYK